MKYNVPNVFCLVLYVLLKTQHTHVHTHVHNHAHMHERTCPHTPGLGGRGHERCQGLSLQSSLGWRCPHSGLGGLCTEPSANE